MYFSQITYDSQEIALRIKETAKEQGKSVRKVLEESNLSPSTISKISYGKDILTLNFAKIADSLDCSVDYLLGRNQQFEPNWNEMFSRCTLEELVEISRILNEVMQDKIKNASLMTGK